MKCDKNKKSFWKGLTMNKILLSLVCVCLLFVNSAFAENNIRAVKIMYQVYNSATGKFDKEIDAAHDYEMLAGYDSLAPIAFFQNVTADKELQFYFGVEIKNPYVNKVIFSQTGWINSYLLANPSISGIHYVDSIGQELNFPTTNYKTGLPPGGYLKVYFKKFYPNEFVNSTLGRLNIIAFSQNQSYPDNKPFPNEYVRDDTVLTTIQTLLIKDAGYLSIFEEDTLYYKGIPAREIWVNKGVEMVDGREFCYNARNSYEENQPSFGGDWDAAISKVKTKYAPVCRMNRVDLKGNDESKYGRGGDTIISCILKFSHKDKGFLSFNVQRGGKNVKNISRGWSDNVLYGPEHRVFSNSTPLIEIRKPDELIFEYLSADSANKEKLLNPDENDWKRNPKKDSAKPGTDISPLRIFGGGGERVGILETDVDSALNYYQGLRADITDDGKDMNSRHFTLMIPDTMISSGYMRLRIRVEAENNSIDGVIQDDADDFFIDNLEFMSPLEIGNGGISSIKVNYPNSIVNSIHTKIPISVVIFNEKLIKYDKPTYYLQLNIQCVDPDSLHCPKNQEPPHSHIINTITGICYYCGKNFNSVTPRFEYVNFTKSFEKQDIVLPPFELDEFSTFLRPGENHFLAKVTFNIPGGDLNPSNDTLYTEFSIYLGDVIAYDPPDAKNDVPEFSGIYDRGLDMFAISSGDYSEDAAFGVKDGSGSGEIAMKFQLFATDTIYGYQAWFENHGFCNDVSFGLYMNSNGLPGSPIPNTVMYKHRGMDDLDGKSKLSAYSTYLYDKPIILPAGTYWATVAQIGDNGFELGGSAARMGMVTTVVDLADNGNRTSSIIIDKNFKKTITDSNKVQHEVPDNFFAYRNSLRDWAPFTPAIGNPAFGHHDRYGKISKPEGAINTYTRGSFIPMLRVYMNGSHYNWSDVKETAQTNELEFYPNPATDYLEITYTPSINRRVNPTVDYQDIVINDVFGKKIPPRLTSSATPQEGNLRIDVSGLPAGVYFVRVGEKIGKFIKI